MLNKKRSLIISIIILSALAGIYIGNGAKTAAYSAKELKEIILAKVSARENVPISDLKIGNTATLKPENVYRAKVLNRKTGDIYGINLDSEYNIVDDAFVNHILNNKRKSQFVGKLSRRLVEKIADMKKSGCDSHIDVAIWLKPDKKAPRFPREKLTDQEKQIHLKDIREFYADQTSTKSLVKRLESRGQQILYISRYAPLIFVRMPVDDVAQIEADASIDCIYASEVMEAHLDKSVPTIKADVAWSSGYTGCCEQYLGYIPRIAIIDKGGIVENHPYLGTIEYLDPNNKNEEYHPTMIAGIIASTHDIYKGVAYGACSPLLSGNMTYYDDPNFVKATDWAITKLATIISCNFGKDTNRLMISNDRYYDFIVRHYARTVVISSGNVLGDLDVSSPGLAWNAITVGAFSDSNTTNWADDVMWDGSCYLNPNTPHLDREKPEVVAPGVWIMSTCLDPNTGYLARDRGTSFAAPHVAGAAALLIDKCSSLEAWPEEIAAILIASAIHDIPSENPNFLDPNAPLVYDDANEPLHDKDGAGGIDIAHALQVIDNGLNSHHTFTSADLPYDEYFSVTQGQKVRAVIRWDSQTYFTDPNDSIPSSDVLEADLDLVAYDPDGYFIKGSTRYDNNYEIVQFTANKTGNYKIRISSKRFDGSEEYVGIAICKY